jgi:hypothetical protein
VAEIPTGYQPPSAPTVRRADYALLQRVAELERALAAAIARIEVLEGP